MREAAWMREAMAAALALAQGGRGRVEPNPRVGAVALQDGKIVGRGFHEFYGGAHAEVVALQDAAAAGAKPETLVVTLEPCSSQPGAAGKKTPPCAEAIVRAGIRRVVLGAVDPDPRHQGRAISLLREQGVEVHSGVLAAECDALNRPFAHWLEMDVPWVIAKWAMSLDGKTGTRSGDSKWISGEASRTRVHVVRGQVDGVMVGLQTAVMDDPELTVRLVEAPNPARIVIDPRAELPHASKLCRTARETPTWVLVGTQADPGKVQALRDLGVEVVEAPEVSSATGREMDLAAGFRALRDRGMRRVLMEGGGGLAGKLFAASLVHQVMVFVAPKVIGGQEAKTPVAGAGVEWVRDAWQVGEVHHELVGSDVVIHGFAT